MPARDDLSDPIEIGRLPNGCTLYRAISRATGAPVYLSDECGILAEVWDSAIADFSTILAAVVDYLRSEYVEQVRSRKR